MCQGQVYGVSLALKETRICRRHYGHTENAVIPSSGLLALCPPAVPGT